MLGFVFLGMEIKKRVQKLSGNKYTSICLSTHSAMGVEGRPLQEGKNVATELKRKIYRLTILSPAGDFNNLRQQLAAAAAEITAYATDNALMGSTIIQKALLNISHLAARISLVDEDRITHGGAPSSV